VTIRPDGTTVPRAGVGVRQVVIAPRAPWQKGRVERVIGFLRHSFFAARSFSSLADLNGQLARWIEDVAHARVVPGEPFGLLVRDALAQERPHLLPLPDHPFRCELVRAVVSGKTPYIRFDGNDYSIPRSPRRRESTSGSPSRHRRALRGPGPRHARFSRCRALV